MTRPVDHGAATIKKFMNDLTELACSGKEFRTSGGAEPHRDYAYLEFHAEGRHSVLVFRVVEGDEGPEVVAHRFDGRGDEVQEQLHSLLRQAA